MGLDEEAAQEKFGFLLDAFAYGAPPHGGIAFGWDRICALLSGADSIREVIAFPKSGGGFDPLTGAPAAISAEQRKEAGVDAAPAEDAPSEPRQVAGFVRPRVLFVEKWLHVGNERASTAPTIESFGWRSLW